MADRNLELHEAMVLVLLERKFETTQPEATTTELARVIQERKLYYQEDGVGLADASQIGARARQYPVLFSASEREGRKIIVLNELPRQVVATDVAINS